MKRIHCEPHETGISFEYDGISYAYDARGFLLVGEDGIVRLSAEEVPVLVRELVSHWKTFSLSVRIDRLAEWLGCCGRERYSV